MHVEVGSDGSLTPGPAGRGVDALIARVLAAASAAQETGEWDRLKVCLSSTSSPTVNSPAHEPTWAGQVNGATVTGAGWRLTGRASPADLDRGRSDWQGGAQLGVAVATFPEY